MEQTLNCRFRFLTSLVLVTIALSLVPMVEARGQEPDRDSNKTEFSIELKDIRANFKDLQKATKADHGVCMECYQRLNTECEKWAAYNLGIDNAKRWERQARAVGSTEQITLAQRALAEMLLNSFSARGKTKSKAAEEAESLYAALSRAAPLDIHLRFEHGRALAFLHRSAEAKDEFAYFLEHAPAADPQMTAARRFVGEPSLAAHRLLPDISIKLVDGKTISTSQLLGHNYVIDLWASWCGSCIQSLPAFHALLTDYEGSHLGALSISIDLKRSAWEAALKKHGLQGAQAIDEDGSIAARLRADTIPRFLFVDSDGLVVFEGANVKDLRTSVEKTLGGKPAA